LKSGDKGATATGFFKVLGFLISSEIGLHHLVDLEALLTTNPGPPTLGKFIAGRRQIVKKTIPATVDYFGIFRHFLV
jgi:hypothetical protein